MVNYVVTNKGGCWLKGGKQAKILMSPMPPDIEKKVSGLKLYHGDKQE
ncbi:MAG: hypothetical protein PHR66_11930 [Desulfuromonadaceae bacterium]|nr:hypothetical protein [Desulfuromonadaceae bacterium]